jgi:hypothetical protein
MGELGVGVEPRGRSITSFGLCLSVEHVTLPALVRRRQAMRHEAIQSKH